MQDFADRLESATTRWALAALLLRTWDARDRSAALHRRRLHDHDWLDHHALAEAHFGPIAATEPLTVDDRAFIANGTADGTDLVAVDAFGFALGDASSATYAGSWKDEQHTDALRLEDGDIFPVPVPRWPRERRQGTRTTAPWALPPLADDHPFARVHRITEAAVIVDFSLWRRLAPLVDGLGRVATLLPNQTDDELRIDVSGGDAFPVVPHNAERQKTIVEELLDRALGTDARIVVLPELSTSASIADDVARRLYDEEEDRLVVCGSWHEEDGAARRNVTRAALSGSRAIMEHRKLTEINGRIAATGAPWREGLSLSDEPVLRIYASNGHRLVLLICKDLLAPWVNDVLKALRVNVVLAPAMSPTMQPFSARLGEHVLNAQAVAVVANGPVDWTEQTAPAEPHGLLARPYHPGDVVQAPAGVRAPALTVLSLEDGTAEVLDNH